MKNVIVFALLLIPRHRFFGLIGVVSRWIRHKSQVSYHHYKPDDLQL